MLARSNGTTLSVFEPSLPGARTLVYRLPGATGLSCLRHLRETAPLTPIMVVSGNDDPATMRDVVLAGATGYVPKSAPRQVLIDAGEFR